MAEMICKPGGAKQEESLGLEGLIGANAPMLLSPAAHLSYFSSIFSAAAVVTEVQSQSGGDPMNFDQCPDAGDLGSHAGVRPGLRALPRFRPIGAEPEELTTEQGYRLLDEIRSFGEPADGLHRRRSAQAAGPLRPDPLQRQDRAAHQRDPQRHAAADGRGHRRFKESRRHPHGHQPGRAGRRHARRFPRHPRHLRPRHVRPAARPRYRPGYAVSDHRHAPQYGPAAGDGRDRQRSAARGCGACSSSS